jgi:hypothetical protein
MRADWKAWSDALYEVWPDLVSQEASLATWFGSTRPRVIWQEATDAASPDAYDEPWGAWLTGKGHDDDDDQDRQSGAEEEPSRAVAERKEEPTAWFGAEAGVYEAGVPRSSEGVVVSLDVSLKVEAGRHVGAAVKHVFAALRRLRSAREAEFPYERSANALEVGPVSAPPVVLVLAERPPHEHLGRNVWVSFRLARVRANDDPRAAIDAGVARLLAHVDWIRDAVHEAQGALAGWQHRLSREVLTGWAGEVVARACLDGGSLGYGAWRDPYDLRGEAGWVEVKSTLREQAGTANWTRAEMEWARRQGPRYRLACVRVDRDLVDTLMLALSSAEPVLETMELSVDALRLVAALEADGGKVYRVRHAVEDAVVRLRANKNGLVVCLRDPLSHLRLDSLHAAVAEVSLDISQLQKRELS